MKKTHWSLGLYKNMSALLRDKQTKCEALLTTLNTGSILQNGCMALTLAVTWQTAVTAYFKTMQSLLLTVFILGTCDYVWLCVCVIQYLC